MPIVTEEAWPPFAGSTAWCCIHPEDDAACDYEADEVDRARHRERAAQGDTT